MKLCTYLCVVKLSITKQNKKRKYNVEIHMFLDGTHER